MTGRTKGIARPARAKRKLSPPPQTLAATARTRWEAVDLLRGIAIVAMIVYHFCFDLAYHGWIRADFSEDWRWIWFRIPILGSFLFVVGVSLALGLASAESGAHFWRRIGKITLAAALVSAGSYVVFPQSFITFGVLHAIALMSVLARPLLRMRWLMLPAAIAIIGFGNLVRSPVFDAAWLNWIGMMTFKPRTEDYVPLFPWFGMMLLGACAGGWAAGDKAVGETLARWRIPGGLRWIGWLGRHSLIVYLVHQPLIFGTMMLVAGR